MKSTKSINLKSSEGKNFSISVAALRHSKLLDTTIEDYPEDNEIFVDVKAEILEKVIEYLIHYEEIEPKEIPEDLIDGNISKIIEPFD